MKVDNDLFGTVEAKDLSKTYKTKEKIGIFKSREKKIRALDKVSFKVQKGEIFGLLGPNGAGKTTLIKILTTLLLPDNGTAKVNGFDIIKQPDDVKATIGVMLTGERSLYWKLTGRENLEYFAALYHMPTKIAQERIKYLVDLLGMEEFIDRLVETYSTGQKMILAFGKALLNDAPIIFLDEPTITMDPRKAREIRELILRINKEEKKTIFITTHLMYEADMLCNRVAIIDRGKIMAIGPPDELKKKIPHKGSIEVECISNAVDAAVEEIRGLANIDKVAVDFGASVKDTTRIKILTNEPREILPKVLEILIKHNISINYVNPSEPTLEDVFIHYTGRTLAEDTREGV